MSSRKEDPARTSPVPTVAAQDTSAGTSASTRQLARAMAQLQKSAANAVFPRQVTSNDLPDPNTPNAVRPVRYGSVELTLMSRSGHHRTTGREASRLYTGAKAFF